MSRSSDFLVIRADGEAIGKVVPEENGFRFFASKRGSAGLDRLDGDLFRNERDAEQAVRRAVAAGRRARRIEPRALH